MSSVNLAGHYALTLYRSLTRHRLYAALNVLGLAVGIAVFLVLWLDVRFETSFERWIPHANQISLLRTYSIGEGFSPLGDSDTMGATLQDLRSDYPQLIGARDWSRTATVRRGGQVTAEQVEAVDPSFFAVFPLPLVAGDPNQVLQSPDEVILTQTKARLYFGAANPLGQRLTIVMGGEARTYRVTAVLKDPPRNTDLRFDFLVPLTPRMIAQQPYWRNWGSEQVDTYLRFDRLSGARALDADLDNFVDRHAPRDITPRPAHSQMRLRTAPLVSLHLLNPKDAIVVAALGAVGLLSLLLAVVNYVNLATARAGLRAREVALRKVMGATGGSLIGQFLGEAMATALLAALIGVALCEVVLPAVNAAGGLALKIDYLHADSILLPTLAAAVLAGIGAGAYPALALSHFQPAPVLAATRTPGGGRAGGRIREALVAFQFAIAIAFIVITAVIVSQTAYLRHADLGFRRDGLIVADNFDNAELTGVQRAGLLDAWRALPGVVGATAANIAPGAQHTFNASNTKRLGAAGQGPSVSFIQTGPGFFRTYGARLLAGRLLDRSHGGDDAAKTLSGAEKPMAAGPSAAIPGAATNIVINAGAVKTLGFRDAADALGKLVRADLDGGRLNPMTIVGIVDDIRFLSPHQPVPATIYLLNAGDIESAIAGVRYAGADPAAIVARMASDWRRVAPDVPFRAKTIEASLQSYYREDDQHGRLFILGALLAVGIACVGLYGLASFTTAQRVREIGIRKTLGASTADILRLLVGQFLRPVILANLIAWPAAWLAMRSWLGGFDQRISLSPLYFLAATALTLLIAVATVAGQAFAVARAEPAKALRHE